MLLDFDPIDIEDTDLEDDDVPLMLMKMLEQQGSKLLKSSAPLLKSPIVQGMTGNTYDFLYHAMNSSIGTNSPNSTVCEESTKNLKMYYSHFFTSMEMSHYNSSS